MRITHYYSVEHKWFWYEYRVWVFWQEAYLREKIMTYYAPFFISLSKTPISIDGVVKKPDFLVTNCQQIQNKQINNQTIKTETKKQTQTQTKYILFLHTQTQTYIYTDTVHSQSQSQSQSHTHNHTHQPAILPTEQTSTRTYLPFPNRKLNVIANAHR